jgi:hypothetical protein
MFRVVDTIADALSSCSIANNETTKDRRLYIPHNISRAL